MSWQLRRLPAARGAAVISSIASSSAEGGGSRASHAGGTMTWQVAQVIVPPQSATMPSTPWSTCAMPPGVGIYRSPTS